MLQLLQFRHSPYNEKVRWALDLKRLPHDRRSLLPGPHVPVVRPLTGRTQTPVLVHDGTAIDGSARILDWLEGLGRMPALLPPHDADRHEARRIQHWFDDDLTPRIRRAVLAALLAEPRHFARVFGDGRPGWQQSLYALVVPLAAPLVRKGNGIRGAESVQDGLRAADEAFDFVAQRSSISGYLAGVEFSLADLTAASTLAVLVGPPDSPMTSPQPMGAPFRAIVERYAQHPGADWVRRIYLAHRGARRDFDGPSDLN